MFSVSLRLDGRRCLVVGGGSVALRKVRSLVESGAIVHVVAPSVDPALSALADDDHLVVERRRYRPGDASSGYALVFVATDSPLVNAQVARDGARANTFVNVADAPDLCTFFVPARVSRGSLEVAVSSGGVAPFVVRQLRGLLEGRIGREWGTWLEMAGRFRTAVRDAYQSSADRQACLDRFIDETLDKARFRVRLPSVRECQEWLRSPRRSGSRVADG